MPGACRSRRQTPGSCESLCAATRRAPSPRMAGSEPVPKLDGPGWGASACLHGPERAYVPQRQGRSIALPGMRNRHLRQGGSRVFIRGTSSAARLRHRPRDAAPAPEAPARGSRTRPPRRAAQGFRLAGEACRRARPPAESQRAVPTLFRSVRRQDEAAGALRVLLYSPSVINLVNAGALELACNPIRGVVAPARSRR